MTLPRAAARSLLACAAVLLFGSARAESPFDLDQFRGQVVYLDFWAAEHFKIQGMPTSVIIDRQGVVRFTHVGFRPVDRATYETQLREVLEEKNHP